MLPGPDFLFFGFFIIKNFTKKINPRINPIIIQNPIIIIIKGIKLWIILLGQLFGGRGPQILLQEELLL